jgi:hypothetical protein
MGLILVLGLLSLAIFVCISSALFTIVANARADSRPSKLQKKENEDGSSSAGAQTS